MPRQTHSVSIDFVTEPGMLSEYGGGAFQVSIDGERLNRYVDEEQLPDRPRWREYVGDYLYGDLYSILETTVEVSADPQLYDERRIQFEGYDEYLVLEYLGEETLRVAYRVPPNAGDDSFDFRAIPASACGYPVDLDDWCVAVRRAIERFRGELRDDGEAEAAAWFDSELATLDEHLNR